LFAQWTAIKPGNTTDNVPGGNKALDMHRQLFLSGLSVAFGIVGYSQASVAGAPNDDLRQEFEKYYYGRGVPENQAKHTVDIFARGRDSSTMRNNGFAIPLTIFSVSAMLVSANEA
jgi:hypothetical protein